jgi:threonyl-tRNA synthetase
MPRITLPDGKEMAYDEPVSALKVAEDIGPRLAKAALGCKINGTLSDINATIDSDCELAIVTATTRDGELDPDGLYLMRHSCAHVMAEAIGRVVPGIQLVYGPPVDNGFYYDIYVPADRPLSSDDFDAIETEMAKIVRKIGRSRATRCRRTPAWRNSRTRAASTRSTTRSARSTRGPTS